MDDPRFRAGYLAADRTSDSVVNMIPVAYICGWCGKENEFTGKDDLVCLTCTRRIFYKKKLAEGMQYEAR